MFRELSRYDAYQPAGDWTGEIPQHWRWDPARTLFRERKETDHVGEPLLSVTIGRGVLPQAELLSSSSKKDSSNLDKSKYKLVRSGDLVYNKMRAWQGAAGLSRYQGIVSPAYIVMTPREGEPAFFHHLVRTPMFAKEAERWSYGITSDQWSLRPEHFKMIRFPVPPPDEQAAIVKYLAHANARIDKAIAAKRRLIELLRLAVEAAVDELLAECTPDGADARRLANVVWEGPTNGTSPAVTESGTLETFSISAVRDGLIDVRASDLKYVEPSSVRDVQKYSLKCGDLLLIRGNGNLKFVGRAGLVAEDMPDRIYPDLLMRVRFRRGVEPEYMARVINSSAVREQIEIAARTAVGTFKLSGADVRGLRVVVPPLVDQRRVLERISDQEGPSRNAIERATAEVRLLQEFRTRLVADVVTGQVDVRGIAATLPEVDLATTWVDSASADGSESAAPDELTDSIED